MEKLILLIVLSITITVVQSIYPRWPQDWRWSSSGPIYGWDCLKIYENSDRAGTWHDNYFCQRKHPTITNIPMRWSAHGTGSYDKS